MNSLFILVVLGIAVAAVAYFWVMTLRRGPGAQPDGPRTTAGKLSQLEVGRFRKRDQGRFVRKVNPLLQGQVGDRAVHHARIDQPVAPLAGQPQADRRLSGSHRPIDCDKARWCGPQIGSRLGAALIRQCT